MTSEQQARFALQARALRDTRLSANAYRLFMLLDAEAWGNDGLKLRQKDIAPMLDLHVRQTKTLIAELVAGRYLIARRTMAGNVYDFNRQKTALSETESAVPRCNKLPHKGVKNCPSIIIELETTSTPPTPPQAGGTGAHSSEGWPDGATTCPLCEGSRKVISRPARSGLRPAASADCPQCFGRGYMHAGWAGNGGIVSFGAKTA